MSQDYDVGAVNLQSPPASSVLTPYRPAVLVRNNGVHDALASGYVRIYDPAGLLIFTTEVYSATIAPGETGLAQGVDYWTPPATGKYIINGYISCPLDQYEPNNNLAPVTVDVTGLPPPPGPTVPLHAAQHEEGERDEISIDGLKGRAADPQDALPHVSSHQAGGSDQINVASLSGELAQPQTPKTHGNPAHDPDMATASALTSHQAAASVHSAATNLASREPSGARAGLVPQAQLAAGTIFPDPDQLEALFALRKDDMWGPTEPKRHHTSHEPGGADAVSITGLIPQGLICVWNTQMPNPPGWSLVGDIPTPAPGYVWILYNPSP